jgi:hypothetical protein
LKFRLVYPPGANPPQREFTFYTDERGETNSSTVYFIYVANNKLADNEVKSKTKWDGSALLVVHQLVFHDGPLTVNSELTMRWEMAGDGKTLTRTLKLVSTSATYLKKTEDGEKSYPLDIKKDPLIDARDNYILLEAKR